MGCQMGRRGARARGASAVRQRRSALASCWGVHESCVVSVSRVRSQQAFMHLTSPTFVVCTLVCTKSTDHAVHCRGESFTECSNTMFSSQILSQIQTWLTVFVASQLCKQSARRIRRCLYVVRPSLRFSADLPVSQRSASAAVACTRSSVSLSLSLGELATSSHVAQSSAASLLPGSPAAALQFLPCRRHLIAVSARLLRGVPSAGRLASLVVPRVIRSARGHAHAVVLPRCGGSGCVMVAWRWMWGAVVNVAVTVDMVEMVA